MTIVYRRRTLVFGAVASLLIGAVAAVYVAMHCGTEASPSPGRVVLPDNGGEMLHIACVAGSARRSAMRNAPLVAAIINALPPKTHVTVLTNDRTAFWVTRDPWPGRVDFVDLPANLNFTIWPQDPFLVVDGRDGPALLASAEFPRLDDGVLARELAKRLEWPCRTSELAFEGGNLVAGSRHVFIGASTIAYNAALLKLSEIEVARMFQRELGRPVVVVGPLPQPVGHVDMMLTPLDERRLVLADPAWGAEIAREQLDRSPQSVAEFELSCEKMCFGDPAIRELRGPKDEAIRSPKVVGRTREAIEKSEAIAARLDRLAKELEKFGYQVDRVPFLLGIELQPDAPATGQAESPREKTAIKSQKDKSGYPTLTYNNVLVEKNPSGHTTIYLPQYGWDAMDRAGREAWQKLAEKVVPVGNFAVSALHGGSLRCCVKVLKRE
jgi:hypothetical protein